jgi:hypothetical protein
MFFRVTLFVSRFLLDMVALMRMTDDEKDVEIMLLRQQQQIVGRKQERGPQIPRWQKVPSAAKRGQSVASRAQRIPRFS